MLQRVSLILCLILTGCNTPIIVENYDEFNDKQVCKLDTYQIAKDSSLISARRTFITLTRQDAEKIKVTISTMITNNYPSLSSSSHLKFNLIDAKGQKDLLTYKGENHKYATELQQVYHQYGTTTIPVRNSSVDFAMNINTLQKIITAKEVNFEFEAKDEPIIGTLDESGQQAFKEFLTKCCKVKG